LDSVQREKDERIVVLVGKGELSLLHGKLDQCKAENVNIFIFPDGGNLKRFLANYREAYLRV
jgi:hypothetical protein